MGNVPAKEGRSRSGSYTGSTSIYSESGGITRTGRRNTTSSIIFNAAHLPDHHKKSKSHEEKEKQREKHYLNLIVRYYENVDGGYLAPFGTYKSNLDYNTNIVRDLIVNRKLAPFYTPLQDFSPAWTDDELLILVSQLPLHSIDTAYSAEEEVDDVDNHKIHKSSNYYKRQEQKLKLQALIDRMKQVQKDEESKYLDEKLRTRVIDHVVDSDLPLKQLLLRLYKGATECPICFLYYPNIMNYSRCCRQPICSECFVQIKRLDPHPPHDDTSNDPSSNELPHTLISEAANCPYCAMPDFGVTYEPPRGISTGANGIKASNWHPASLFGSIPEDAVFSSSPERSDELAVPMPSPTKARRRSSVAADAPGVITTDFIRPDWEQKLASARNKLARKAATASAIHASNLLISGDNNNSESSNNSSGDRNRRASHENGGRSTTARYNQLQSVEERMIEQALRLSILDEEERKRKAELERKK